LGIFKMPIFRKFVIYLFIVISFTLFKLSPCLARTDNVFVGDIGEKYMDYLHTSTYSFQPEKWQKIEGEIGRNGIDGLYVRRHKTGEIKKVLIGESKYGTSVLGRTKYGRQMSQLWVERKVERLIKGAENNLAKSKHWKQRQSLSKKLNDYKSIQKHLLYNREGKATTLKKQVFKSQFKNGRLYVKRYKVQDLDQKNVSLKRIKGPGQLEKGIILRNEEIKKIQNSKTRNFHVREREKLFTPIQKSFIKADGLSKEQANKIIDDLKNGKITRGKELQRARNDAINEMRIGRGKKGMQNFAPKKFRKNLSRSISFLEKSKFFKNLFGKSLTGIKIVSFVSVALEFKYICDWQNNQISNRKFAENTAMVIGGAAGYHVGKVVGEGTGALVGVGLNAFGFQVDTNSTRNIGKHVGGITGAAVGALAAQKTVKTYFEIKDEEALKEYNLFLRNHLVQASL